MQAQLDTDESPIQDSHHSEATRSKRQKDGHGDPKSAHPRNSEPQGLQAQAQAQAHKKKEEEESDVVQAADSGEEIRNGGAGILQTGDRLLIPVGIHANPQGASASSSSNAISRDFVAERWETATSRTLESLQTALHETDEDGLGSSAAPEYFQGEDICVPLSCQDYAAIFRSIVPPDFRVPENVRRDIQLPENPREEEIDIPVISLELLKEEETVSDADQLLIKRQISEACADWGVFQVKDHGIPNSLLEGTLDAVRRFFDLPREEKMLYSILDSKDGGGYGGSKSPYCRLWGDYMLHELHLQKSLEQHNLPTQPSGYGELMLTYAKQVMAMNMLLIDACAQVQDVDVPELETALREEYLNIIAKSYGTTSENLIASLDSADSVEAVSDLVTAEAVRADYHPPCPQPELVLCRGPCCARTAFEIVLQNDVPGLQFSHDGRWRTIKFIPNALVVFVGNSLQLVSQDMTNPYTAAQYRVVADRKNARISVTSACGAEEMVNPYKAVEYRAAEADSEDGGFSGTSGCILV